MACSCLVTKAQFGWVPRSTQRVCRRSRRWFSSIPEGVVHCLGDFPYGSRQYILLPPGIPAARETSSLQLASLNAHKHVLFGARAFRGTDTLDVCLPLVDAALEDAGMQGEQPQAMASLYGLCDYVVQCQNGSYHSDVLTNLQEQDPVGYEAVQAMATGIPRPGHSVVGVGTFRDAQAGWTALAKEFCERGLSAEVNLYKQREGTVVKVEHLADQKEDYKKSAGGAMVRMFFL